jgi:ribosomal protein S18 acetylase RimI-like enzyme
MPRITDLVRVQALLNRDPAWAAYAIGDLGPEFIANCEWYASSDGTPALVLVYRGFDTPIVFAIGAPADLAPIFRELDFPVLSMHLRQDAVAALSSAYEPIHTSPMWRMVLERSSFRPARTDDVIALDESSLDAVTALYEDGHRHGEGPTFFQPWMLGQGTFRGIREGSDLVAVAGSHVFSPAFGVCAIGNVYTRRDRRRRGLGARATSAVVQHAIDHEIPTIVLNVSQENDGARRVYEALGFRRYCEFFEGECRGHQPGRSPV